MSNIGALYTWSMILKHLLVYVQQAGLLVLQPYIRQVPQSGQQGGQAWKSADVHCQLAGLCNGSTFKITRHYTDHETDSYGQVK